MYPVTPAKLNSRPGVVPDGRKKSTGFLEAWQDFLGKYGLRVLTAGPGLMRNRNSALPVSRRLNFPPLLMLLNCRDARTSGSTMGIGWPVLFVA